tara:strand:- start:290 stop:655 length:366 start_codon:yes stop_codon:yes gene_type:complete
MATLKAKLILTSTDLTTDSLSSETTNSLTVTEGGVQRKDIAGTSAGAATVLAVNGEYSTGTYVYLRNCDTTAGNYLYVTFSTGDHLIIQGGEWAWLPWSTAADIKVHAQTANTIVEYGIFS